MKVIVAIDESPYSKTILETIADRKWPPDTHFKILSVVESMSQDEVDDADWQMLAKQAFKRREKA